MLVMGVYCEHMYIVKILLLALLLVFALPSETGLAHPGNVASDGAHYCWTNCASWGEVYGQRHYHGGGINPEPYYEPTPDYDYDPPDPDYDYDPPDPEYTGYQATPATPATTAPSSQQDSSNNYSWVWWVLFLGFGAIIVYIANKDR